MSDVTSQPGDPAARSYRGPGKWPSFTKIPRDFMQSHALGSARTPSLYYHPNYLLRTFFWERLRAIHRQMKMHGRRDARCLDFGGGGGVFLPTLCKTFPQVDAIDLETREAAEVVSHFKLQNVSLIEGDINTHQSPSLYGNIVAADVLEHFKDLSRPVAAISRWLSDTGVLFTSLPTENWIYVGLRKVFNVTKPFDHYHTAQEVESYLEAHGFVKLHRVACPLGVPLFSICAWQKSAANH